MPGADDGAQDAAAALAGLQALANDGVETVVAAVHLDGSLVSQPNLWREYVEHVDAAYEELQAIAAAHLPSLDVRRGAEIKLDTPDIDFSDARMRIAGTRFVLVEFSGLEVPPYGAALLEHVARDGYQPILAHPERYRGPRDVAAVATSWVEAGAHLQMNHGSLSGRYGRTAQSGALALLGAGLVSYVSSDFHARGETWTRETLDALSEAEGGDAAVEVLAENGRRLIQDEAPRPVPPLRRPMGIFESLFSFRRS